MTQSRSFWSRVGRVARDPSRIAKFVRYRWGLRQVRQEWVDGELFHVYQGERYPDRLNQGNAASHILDKAREYCSGHGLDIGSNEWPFPGATAVDNDEGRNAYELDFVEGDSLDFVFSSHCLEHLDHWSDALKLWISKLKTGGVLFLYLPHESMKLWNPGAPWVMDGHRWQPTHEVLVPFLKATGMTVLDYETDRDDYWSFHIVARKGAAP